MSDADVVLRQQDESHPRAVAGTGAILPVGIIGSPTASPTLLSSSISSRSTTDPAQHHQNVQNILQSRSNSDTASSSTTQSPPSSTALLQEQLYFRLLPSSASRRQSSTPSNFHKVQKNYLSFFKRTADENLVRHLYRHLKITVL